MSEITLTVNGKTYGGWITASARLSIEQLSGSFELTVTEKWADQPTPWPIFKGDACRLAVAGETVITGHVDDTMPSFDKESHSIMVVGRDATGDLVDCSAISASGQWTKSTMTRIAADLCRPYGISVIAQTDVGAAFPSFAIQEGETVFEAIERMARMRGVLCISDGMGNLVITRAGSATIETALMQGENVLSGSAMFSMRDEYSAYICKGQGAGSDWTTPDQAAQPKAQATDANVGRYRPLVVIMETEGDSAAFKNRALWEAAVRMGRSARPTVTVQGWKHAGGLWRINRLVPCKIPYFRLDRQMLIASVVYRAGEDGTTTDIELVPPEAFKTIPILKKKDEAGAW